MKAASPHQLRQDQSGIALMLVIWILAVLMAIVLSVSFMTKVESRSTIAFKEGIEEKFIAEAGIERAAEEIMYRKINLGVPVEEGKETNVWRTDGTPNTFPLENGTCLVRIIDESGKIDINKVPDIILKGLLTSLGVKDEDADVIVDSIEDWRDADDLTRLHGAETDYYMSLAVPYKAKNADIESIEELLLVRGMTPELFYGSGNKPGLQDFVTVYSENGKINVNAAP
jgi:general secretion pathway protein K